ncbi:hypothetical protein [Cupriavidus pauculus]|uniref:Uncharacterized protein n=1 Tax=Cupriavidus pauculus TaxID=82633 RepID=A0A3G8H0V5_9BURK|nr:hypothetical protein [Cupriavidus pauculus]AZG14004.1 hypothetical protein EHF44_11440 [Cupriavidus pauculus]
MTRLWTCLIFLLAFGGSWAASAKECESIPHPQAFRSLITDRGTVCFAIEPVEPDSSDGMSRITLYYLPHGAHAFTKSQGSGMMYDSSPGRIVDAFVAAVDSHKRIFVIHALEVRSSLAEPNSSGNFYSVDVFEPTDAALLRDERASNWFGAGYSYISKPGEGRYKFPYLSRNDVLRALDSPFAPLMIHKVNIPARLKRKSFLFHYPMSGKQTQKYLTKGDRATVTEVRESWCRLSHPSHSTADSMWILCRHLGQ